MLHPTADLVALKWLESLSALMPTGTGFANVLPDPWPTDVGPSSWEGRDFITVQTVGGFTNRYLPQERVPIVTVNCWSRPLEQKARPPWARANQLAEVIRLATYTNPSAVIDMPGNYMSVKIGDVSLIREPTRIPDDPQGMARYTTDLELVFVALEGV